MNSHAKQCLWHRISQPSTLLPAALAIGITLMATQVIAEDGFIPDRKGCKVSNPSPKPNETVEWSGDCLDGYADGKGVLQWYVDGAPSTRYEGTIHGGVLSGQGKLSMPNGASYEGQWLAGKQDGKGVQAMPDGTRYEGEWRNGQPNGHGVLRDAAGETLEGDWEDGAYVGSEKNK